MLITSLQDERVWVGRPGAAVVPVVELVVVLADVVVVDALLLVDVLGVVLVDGPLLLVDVLVDARLLVLDVLEVVFAVAVVTVDVAPFVRAGDEPPPPPQAAHRKNDVTMEIERPRSGQLMCMRFPSESGFARHGGIKHANESSPCQRFNLGSGSL